MGDLDTIRILGGDIFRAWLASLLDAEQLGSELVLSLPGADNATRADTLLAAAARLGWIVRSFFAPSREQQFFGVGGSAPINHPTTKDHHGQLWCWRALDRAALLSYAGHSAPANLQIGEEVRYTPTFIAQIQGGPSMSRARGRVVGYAFDGRAVRVRWDDDPEEERARESPYWDGEGEGERMVPYAARAVMVGVVRRVGPRAVKRVEVVKAVPMPAPQPQPAVAAPTTTKSQSKQLDLFTL